MIAVLVLAANALALGPVTHALHQVIATQVADPDPRNAEGWRTVRTEGWSLVSWRAAGTEVTFDESPCAVQTERVYGTETHYSSAFLAALRATHSGRWVAGRFEAAWRTALGPADADGDGLPGVTVDITQSLLGRGQVQVAQVTETVWRGTADGDAIRGVIEARTQQTLLGATTWWLRREARSRPHPDPAQSTFALVPFTGDCAALLRARGTLFPR